MAGSTRASAVTDRRWDALRRAARARLAPFGAAVLLAALGVVYTPTFARLMRGQVLAITARDYVDAARALGAPGWRIAWRHVLPSATAPMVVQASLSVAFAILAEASLSFLGLGIQPPA